MDDSRSKSSNFQGHPQDFDYNTPGYADFPCSPLFRNHYSGKHRVYTRRIYLKNEEKYKTENTLLLEEIQAVTKERDYWQSRYEEQIEPLSKDHKSGDESGFKGIPLEELSDDTEG